MNDVYLCDGIRTPIGRYGGALSSVRADDLAAIPLKALMGRNPGVDWAAVLADHPYEFAQAVLGLLNDPEKRLRVNRAGRSYVEKYHDWRKAAADLEDIYLAISETAPVLA